MRENITQAIEPAAFGREIHTLLPIRLRLAGAHLITQTLEQLRHARGQRIDVLRRMPLRMFLHVAQTVGAIMQFKTVHIVQHFRCIANQANAGGRQQKNQHRHKPRLVIHIV